MVGQGRRVAPGGLVRSVLTFRGSAAEEEGRPDRMGSPGDASLDRTGPHSHKLGGLQRTQPSHRQSSEPSGTPEAGPGSPIRPCRCGGYRMGLGICGWATSRGVGAWGSTVPGMTEAPAAPHRPAVGDLGGSSPWSTCRRWWPTAVACLTGPAGSADVLVRGATVGSSSGLLPPSRCCRSRRPRPLCAACAAGGGGEWVVLLSTARTQRAHKARRAGAKPR